MDPANRRTAPSNNGRGSRFAFRDGQSGAFDAGKAIPRTGEGLRIVASWRFSCSFVTRNVATRTPDRDEMASLRHSQKAEAVPAAEPGAPLLGNPDRVADHLNNRIFFRLFQVANTLQKQ